MMRVLLVLLALANSVTSALGSAFFVETGGGITQMRGGEAFFGGDHPSVTGFGGAFNLGVYYHFTDTRDPVGFQVGLHERFSSASTDNYFSIHSPYLAFRAQLSRVYVSAGISPLVYKRVSDMPGIDHFERSLSTVSYFAEAGMLWPITQEFSLGASLSMQYVRASSVAAFSPKPILDFGVMMRFYFGHSSGSGAKASAEWAGYRYPFGWNVGDKK